MLPGFRRFPSAASAALPTGAIMLAEDCWFPGFSSDLTQRGSVRSTGVRGACVDASTLHNICLNVDMYTYIYICNYKIIHIYIYSTGTYYIYMLAVYLPVYVYSMRIPHIYALTAACREISLSHDAKHNIAAIALSSHFQEPTHSPDGQRSQKRR